MEPDTAVLTQDEIDAQNTATAKAMLDLEMAMKDGGAAVILAILNYEKTHPGGVLARIDSIYSHIFGG